MTLAIIGYRRPLPRPRRHCRRRPRTTTSVRRAIAHIAATGARSRPSKPSRTPPASAPTELHHLFRRWAGLTPKAFMQALTLDHARDCCAIPRACSMPPTRSACPDPAGCTICSSPTRRCRRANGRPAAKAHDLLSASTPRPFGTALVMIATARAWPAWRFADAGKERSALRDMRSRWPRAKYVEDFAAHGADWRAASSIPRCGGPSSRCAWC